MAFAEIPVCNYDIAGWLLQLYIIPPLPQPISRNQFLSNRPIEENCSFLQILYWGTAKWSPVEIFETFSMARSLQCVPPLCEYAEYHPFHREKVRHRSCFRLGQEGSSLWQQYQWNFVVKVELYMAELHNKIGTGLVTWSPVSLGLCSGTQADIFALFTKLAVKVNNLLLILYVWTVIPMLQSGKYCKGGLEVLSQPDPRAPTEATLRVKQLETVSTEKEL